MAASQLQVTNNPARSRWEAHVDGFTAFADYTLNGRVVTFPHTVVPPQLEGRGIGSQLARAALDDARSRDLSVVPSCPFFRGFIERHREYEDLVDPAFRRA